MHRLRCFGRLAVEDEEGERVRLSSRKHLAVLVYLAAHRDRRHDRERVARLFWDTDPDRARHSLSQALYDVGRHLPDLEFDRTNQQVGLRPGGLVYDGQALDDAVGDDDLGRAVRLYEGAFAPDLETAGGSDFARWVERERTRYRSLAEKTLLRRVSECAEDGRWGEMVLAGTRLVDMNPLHEEGHRAVMRGLWLQGDRTAALAHFEEHGDALRRELADGFDPETRELVEKIRSADRPSNGRVGHERPRPEMVGREEEFGVLKEALTEALGGESRFVAIEGEAGIGKTRLLEEFADVAALEDARVVSSRCHAAASDVPYGPIVDGLGELAQEVAVSASDEGRRFYQLAHVFPGSFGEPEQEEIYTTADARRRRLAEEFVTFVREASSDRPLVWLIDDAHWMDQASRSLVHYLANRLGECPVLVVGSRRPGEGHAADDAGPPAGADGGWTRLVLSHLSYDDLGRLLDSQDDTGPVGEDAVARLHDLSGGNPFFALELISRWDEIADPGDADGGPGPQELISEDVEDLLESQVQKLSRRDVQLLKAIAVAVPHARPRLLTELTGMELSELATSSSALYESGLLVDEGRRLSFQHDLIRRYVYQSTKLLTRASLHLLTAEELEGRDDVEPATLARHFARADESGKAFQHGVAAARDAENRAAHAEAVRLAELARTHAPSPAAEARALSIEARAQFALGRIVEAAEAAEAALETEELVGNEHVDLALLYSDALIEQGELERARERLRSVEERDMASVDDAPAELAWTRFLLLRAAVFANEREAAARVLEDVSVDAEEQDDLDEAGSAFGVLARLSRAAYEAFYGDVRDAESLLASVEPALDELPYDLRRRVYSLRSAVEIRLGRWSQARTVLHRLAADARERNDIKTLSLAYGNMALVRMEEGEFDTAIELIEHSLSEHGTPGGASNHEAVLTMTKGDALFYREEFAEAEEHYRHALDVAEEGGLQSLLPNLYASYGLSVLPLGRLDEAERAREYVDAQPEALGAVQDRFQVYWLEAALRAARDEGDPVEFLRERADDEETSDIPGAKRLRWLAELYDSDGPDVRAGRLEGSPKLEPLREIGMTWFAYRSRRWLQRVEARVSH